MSLPGSWIRNFFYPNNSGKPVLPRSLENLVLAVAKVSPVVFGLYNSLRSDRVVPAVNDTVVTCTYRLKAECKGEKLQCHELLAFTIWKKGRVLGSAAFHVACLLWAPPRAAAIPGHYKWNRKAEKVQCLMLRLEVTGLREVKLPAGTEVTPRASGCAKEPRVYWRNKLLPFWPSPSPTCRIYLPLPIDWALHFLEYSSQSWWWRWQQHNYGSSQRDLRWKSSCFQTENGLRDNDIKPRVSEWEVIQEAGVKLKPMYGPGYTGMKNLGNSCYLNAVMQAIFSIPEFQRA